VARWLSGLLREFQMLQGSDVVGLIFGHVAQRLRLLQVLLFCVRILGDREELPGQLQQSCHHAHTSSLSACCTSSGRPHWREADGLCRIPRGPGPGFPSTRRVTEPELRCNEIRIDLQRRAIVRQRAFEISSHALELP